MADSENEMDGGQVPLPQFKAIKKENMFTDYKSWIESRTVWSILVASAAILSKQFHFDVEGTMADVLNIAQNAGIIVGLIGGIVFRVKAKAKLT